MGCGASSGNAPPPHDESNEEALMRYLEIIDEESRRLHVDADFDQIPEGEEARHLARLDEEWSIHSIGKRTNEPSAFVCSMRETKITAVARIKHGINGETDQFEPPPEPESDLRSSFKVVRAWFDRNDALALQAEHSSGLLSSMGGSADGANAKALRSMYKGEIDVSQTDFDLDASYATSEDLTPRAGGSTTLLGESSSADYSMIALDMGRDVMRNMRGGEIGTPLSPSCSPGTSFLAAQTPRLPLRTEVLAAHLRRLRALERAAQQNEPGSPGRDGKTPRATKDVMSPVIPMATLPEPLVESDSPPVRPFGDGDDSDARRTRTPPPHTVDDDDS